MQTELQKRPCQYITSGGIYACHIMFCCHAHHNKLLTEEDLEENIQTYKSDISNLHKEVELKRKEMLVKFSRNEIPECINCRNYIPYDGLGAGIVFVNASLILRCQLSCIFCFEGNRQEGNPEILRLMKKYLVWLAQNNHIRDDAEVLWTGGEPTLLPDFADLLHTFSFLKKPQNVLTNAIIFSQEVANLLKNNKVNLLISIDSGSRDTYKAIKGRDFFDKVTQNIIRYREQEKGTSGIYIKYIISPGYNDNLNEFQKFYDFCTKYNLKTELAFDFNAFPTHEQFELVIDIIRKFPSVGIDYLLMFSQFNEEQKNKLQRKRRLSMASDTQELHSCFLYNAYEIETDGQNQFFWTSRNSVLKNKTSYLGAIFKARSACNKLLEVKIIHSSGKIEYFYISEEWRKAAIKFDSPDDIITLSLAESIQIENDSRELGCCFQKVTFTNSIDRILEYSACNAAPWLTPDESRRINRMTIDASTCTYFDEWKDKRDYVRYRTIELLLFKIDKEKILGDVAEVGVYLGATASLINKILPDRTLFLYDTFSGFDTRDLDIELKNNDVSTEILDILDNCDASKCIQNPEDYVINNLPSPNAAVLRKGYFPETIEDESDNKFAFVSIDCDLYKPILASLEFFYPRLTSGGYIIIHDYHSETMFGAKRAVEEFEQHLSAKGVKLAKFFVTDLYGSLAITKN